MKNLALATLMAFSLFAVPAAALAVDAPVNTKPAVCCCGDACKCVNCTCDAKCAKECGKDKGAKCPCRK